MTPEPFPALLRRLRQARGWSQARLAEELCRIAGRPTVTRQEVYRWECGRRVPHWWLPYIAVALEVPRVTLERAIAFPVPERKLEEMLPADPLPVPGNGGREVGQETADYLANRVHSIRLADDVIPGKDLIGPAFRELNAAVRVVKEGTYAEAVGQRLLVAVGELAQIAGWIAHDAGQLGRAEDTYRLGLSAAREAGDTILVGQLAGTLAYQWSNNGREVDGLALARAALEEAGEDAPPRARALFWDRIAWAHTKMDDARGAMRALGEAGQALGEQGGEDEPTWLYWVDANELKIMEARCFTELRRPLRAVPLLTDALGRYDAVRTREFTLYSSWLAVALVDANEPEHAADVAMRMLTATAALGSDRITERTRVVLDKLRPHQDIAEVAAMFEVARALGVC